MSPRWPEKDAPTPREAAALQQSWRERVVRTPTFDPARLHWIAGVDVSVKQERARAAACLFRYPELELVETATAELAVVFPYVPGLLGFREVPALSAAIARLGRVPELLLVDGQGLAHPRRFGVATHLGVELDLPSIGCAKSVLVGEFREPAARRGSRALMRHEGEVIGCALRTRAGVKPIYISIGHRIDLDTAVRIALSCSPRFRLPEPIRCADHLAGTEVP
jgi:deoxyribonuclease V